MSVLPHWKKGYSTTYSKVALCRLASSQPFANLVRDLMFPSSQSRDWSVLYGLFLEFDRHGELVAGGLRLSRYHLVSEPTSHLKGNGAFTMGEVCEDCFDFG